jgi:hypothetical protein
MELSSLEVDPAAIEQGDWVDDIPDCGDLRIRTRGINNAEYRRRYQQKLLAVPSRERRSGLPPETAQRIVTECLIETCVLGWENLLDAQGQPIPCDRATVQRLLLDPRYGPLRDACLYAAGVIADRRAEDREAAEKNSATA